MQIHEWSVMATDWLLAAVSLWLSLRLRRNPQYRLPTVRAVSIAFLAAALAATTGGVRHGMGPWFPSAVYAVLWFFSYAFIVPAWVMLVWGVLRARARSGWVVAGTTVSCIATAVQQGFPLGTQGTLHDDLFHLLMVPAVYAYYRAALLFR